VEAWASLAVLIAFLAFFYYRYKRLPRLMVGVFDALFILVDKYGNSNDREAYNGLLSKYRDENGRFFKTNSTALYLLRRDAKLFIAQHFSDRENAMAMYKGSIRDIIEK
jgi:hypothetical protein